MRRARAASPRAADFRCTASKRAAQNGAGFSAIGGAMFYMAVKQVLYTIID
jgi:hypothetical protein